MRFNRALRFLVALVCASFLWAQSTEWTGSQISAASSLFQVYAKPTPAPDFSLENLQGKAVDIRDYRGQVVLLNFWATWCPNCRQESPCFEKLHLQYGAKGLVVLRIDTKESLQTVAKFAEKESLTAPVLLDKAGKVGRLFGIWAHPTTYLIDRRGMVRYRTVGPVDWTGPEPLKVIDQLLKER
jgi:peroxiredoxin